ncbi:uncharacterized protein K452DRAFT_290797 [Aplosporella prunicola CBS 121167]|uniref:Uncharacterized protein n=1 Tax=Aplosporella prunicola CBS 121167 TaxID=1176127 RepID=A0A6A6B4T1_9PEZI|nr:uncharacterized protein K452DRAFT_290797 [Aplosporella prunicola CBS 121167]KAF2138214.1 hypothetical protein K452DRAFT_290797 [Aplosporella prunicola CBS 121167]
MCRGTNRVALAVIGCGALSISQSPQGWGKAHVVLATTDYLNDNSPQLTTPFAVTVSFSVNAYFSYDSIPSAVTSSCQERSL